MKGISEIEFIISVFVFMTSVSFVTVIVINNIPLFHGASASEGLKAKSWQYSEILLFDEGYPIGWDTNPEISRIGLSAGSRYLIDLNKVDRLRVLCAGGYSQVKGLLGLDVRNDIIIDVSGLDDSPVVGSSPTVCKPPVTTQLRPQFQTVRLGVLDYPGMPIIRMKITVL